MVIFISVLLLTLISIKDLSKLKKKSLQKEITVYSFLTILSLVMATLVLLDIQFPSPQDFINWVGKSAADGACHMFKCK